MITGNGLPHAAAKATEAAAPEATEAATAATRSIAGTPTHGYEPRSRVAAFAKSWRGSKTCQLLALDQFAGLTRSVAKTDPAMEAWYHPSIA